MRADHAARIANAVRGRLWQGLAICPPDGGWRDVMGDVMRGGVAQSIEGFSAAFAAVADELHVDTMDFAPYTAWPKPTTDWWVRFKDVGGLTQIARVAAPFELRKGGRFMSAPLKPFDPADQIPG